jgi:hypothetical protein
MRAARPLVAAAVLGTVLGAAPHGVAAAPAGAPAVTDTVIVNTAAREATLKRLYAKKLHLALEAESLRELAAQVLQDGWIRITVDRDLAHEPLTVCADCTFGELRDGLAALCGFQIQPIPRFESLMFRLIEPLEVQQAALRPDPPPVKHSGTVKPASKGSKLHPAPPAPRDAELLKPLLLAKDLPAIDKDDLFLPAIQQRLAKSAGIRILSDYADRTENSLGKQPPEAFFRSLEGMPLGQALDKIAARFDYTWRKSHGWYLFRSRHWKTERQERLNQAEAAEEEDETVSRHRR